MLIVKNITVSVGDRVLLDDISFTIDSGSIQVLMGANGSGKSSLVYALMGHPRYTIQSGSVFLGSTNLLELPVEQRARMGLFLSCQYPQAVPGVEVFTFLREAHRMLTGEERSISGFKQELSQALNYVGLADSFMHRHLNDDFSGGEKKRLELVQLLLFKPAVALLDELDSGLDQDAVKLLIQIIQDIKLHRPTFSCLVISHSHSFVRMINPDLVQVLQAGRLIYSGTHEIVAHIEHRGYDGLCL